jgi:hypothetical protein
MWPWIFVGAALLLIASQQQGPTQAGQANLSPFSLASFFSPLPLTTIPVSTVTRPSSVFAGMNPNVIRIEGGTKVASPQPTGVQNVLFQSGRDPLEAQQPPAVIMSDNSGSNTDQIFAASLPGATTRERLPSISLGPTISQQSAGLLSFAGGGVDAGGNINPEGEFHTNFV